jgi:hypothetical protein
MFYVLTKSFYKKPILSVKRINLVLKKLFVSHFLVLFYMPHEKCSFLAKLGTSNVKIYAQNFCSVFIDI